MMETNQPKYGEPKYSISYYRPGTKERTGVSISCNGDRMGRVLKNAKKMLRQAFIDAAEVDKEVAPSED